MHGASPRKPPAGLGALITQAALTKPTRPTRTMVRMKDGTQCVEIDGKHFIWLQDNDGSIGPEYKLPKDPMAELKNVRRFFLSVADEFLADPVPAICIATYNVMADVFSPPEQFPRHAPDHVTWLYRGPRIVAEIMAVNPDLLCVQELGVDAEGAHFRPVMTSQGYEGIYKPNAWKEGCAIYWRKEKFEKVETRAMDYPALVKAKLPGAQAAGDTHLVGLCEELARIRHHSVVVLALLKLKDTGALVAIVTSHLFWGGTDPKVNTQLQILQAELALTELHRMCSSLPAAPAIFVCGDFNAQPQGSLCKLLREGTLHSSHPEWALTGTPQSAPQVPYQLASSYAPLNHPITHGEDSFKACIDYIFHSQSITPISLLNLPELKEDAPLPTDNYPSDHLMIAARCTIGHSSS